MLTNQVLLSYIILLVPVTISLDSAVVLTTDGPVKGKEVNDRGVLYYSFQGIPYAEPPIGHLRFKPPVQKLPWTEVRDATKERPVCPQPVGNYVKSQMSENCLFINVYVPAYKTKELAVLVFIHGGEFKGLSGNGDVIYGPQLLLQLDVIVVTLNYRLGALGFLSLDIEDASGNAGLKDILLALKWVKTNIDRFGGDRNRITLGGNSAGSVAAHYLLLTKKSAGLFSRAILISGSALGYRFLARHAKENALVLAKQLGLQPGNTQTLLKTLKEVDAFDIVQAQEDMGQNDTRKGFRPFAPFVPSIEIDYAEAIIKQNPREIIRAGIPQNVPILVGFNTDEGLKMIPTITKNSQLTENLNENFELCIPSDIEYPYGSEESRALGSKIKEFYFGGDDISSKNIQNFVNLITDTMFSYSVDSWIKYHKDREDSNVLYYYVFGFEGDLNWFKIVNNVSRSGTAHADELGYIFRTRATKSLLNNLDTESKQMVDIWTTILTNFIKFGNPNPQRSNTDTIWLESGRERNYLYINECLENRNGPPVTQNQNFWQDVYHKYFHYVTNGGHLESKLVP